MKFDFEKFKVLLNNVCKALDYGLKCYGENTGANPLVEWYGDFFDIYFVLDGFLETEIRIENQAKNGEKISSYLIHICSCADEPNERYELIDGELRNYDFYKGVEYLNSISALISFLNEPITYERERNE